MHDWENAGALIVRADGTCQIGISRHYYWLVAGAGRIPHASRTETDVQIFLEVSYWSSPKISTKSG
jgi:hypothetical protein